MTASKLAKTFGANLKRLRESRGWYQKELAEKCKFHWNHVAQFECGRRLPSFHYLIRLADVLAVSLDELTGRE